MDSKEIKIDAAVESLQIIIKKLREKGPDFLDKQQMAICLITVGFQDVCKKVGVTWNVGIQKEFRDKLQNIGFDIGWLDKKTLSELAPFIVHCTRGDVTKVKQYIKKTSIQQKSNLINAVDSSKKSALHIASKQGYDVLIDFLISQKFKIDARDRQLKTPLHYACIGAHENAVHSLVINNADVYAKDYKGQCSLHCAVRNGSSKIVSQLLEKAPRLTDAKDFAGKTPLHYAAVSGTDNQVDVIRLLIENGTRLDERDNDGRTALHYACEYGKARCIPILLKNKASINMKDNAKKSPLDLASNDKIRKIIEAYSQQKGILNENQQKQFKRDFNEKLQKSEIKDRNVKFNLKESNQPKPNPLKVASSNNPLLGGQINQVSTWLRQKFFVLMKKLQQSGVKIRYHLKKPFCYTGSWMEQIEGIEELFSVFSQLSGPEVAMRTFNLLCPYEKKLPTGISTIDAIEGFFGETWFGGHTAIDNIRKTGKGQVKLKKELEDKLRQLEEYKLANVGYQSQLQKLEVKLSQLNEQIRQYKKIEDDVRKQRVKNAKQYSQILKLTDEIEQLKKDLSNYQSGHDANLSLQQKITQLKKKNQDLIIQIDALKSYEAAARRKCGKVFLKALYTPLEVSSGTLNNLYDDDAIIHLYQLLQNNPPNMVKRLQKANRSGNNQLTVFQFNYFLQQLGMLPQDIMSMNRIVGFVSGKKLLSIEEFKQILKNRPQIRVQWQRKLINKIKFIIKHSEVGSVQKLFNLLDKDGSHSLSISELKLGLEQYNIYINQNDINNLFSLIDADRSGNINLEQLGTLLKDGVSAKKVPTGQQFERQEQDVSKESKKSRTLIDTDKNQEEDYQEQGYEQNNNQEEQNNQYNDQQGNKQQSKEQQQGNQERQQQIGQDQFNGEEQNKQEYPSSPEKNYSVHQQQLDNSQLIRQSEEDMSPIVNGKCKVQIPFCKQIPNQQIMNHVVLKVEFFGHETVKIGDFSNKKWEIAIQFKIQQMRMSHATPLKISAYAQRQYDEDNFLGQIEIPFEDIQDKPNKWAINKSFPLQPSPEYQKEVGGKIGVQAKWIQQEFIQYAPQ